MNETSLHMQKLVSGQVAQPRAGSGVRGRITRLGLRAASKGLVALRQRAQAARADVQAHGAVAQAQGHPLHVGVPAPLGVALRKADIVAELWPSLATESAPVRHCVIPPHNGYVGARPGTGLSTRIGADAGPQEPERLFRLGLQETDCIMSGRFLQTARACSALTMARQATR